MSLYRKIIGFFDRFEDIIRGWISKRPVLFGLVGGVAVVEFWRGVWHLTDYIFAYYGYDAYGLTSSMFSILFGSLLMLSTGLYVSLFVGDSIILSGIKKEKKFFEKTENELKEEDSRLAEVNKRLIKIEEALIEIKKHHEQK